MSIWQMIVGMDRGWWFPVGAAAAGAAWWLSRKWLRKGKR